VTVFIWLVRRDLAAAMFGGLPNIPKTATCGTGSHWESNHSSSPY